MTGWLRQILVACLLAAPTLSPAESREARVDAVFEAYNHSDGPGLSVGIARGGKTLYTGAYGLADLEQGRLVTPGTVFHVASVSKQFTAFAIALLASEGKVDLDADIRTYLPYVPDFGHRITVRHLLYHTSGLRDQWNLFMLGGHDMAGRLSQRQITNMVARQTRLNFEPGTRHMYSNTGYTLLAEIVHATSGQSLREYAHERIFAPLEMDATFFYDNVTELAPERAHSYREGERGAGGRFGWRRALLNYDNAGATSLFTTAGDLLLWAHHLSAARIGTPELVGEFAQMGTLDDGTPINYGFALAEHYYAGHRALHHSGSDAGFVSLLAHFPEADFSVALLANAPVDLARSMERIVEIYLGRAELRPQLVPPEAIEVDDSAFARLRGHYLPPEGRLVTIERQKGKLVATEAAGEHRAILQYRTDGSFEREGGRQWGYYQPRIAADGSVRAIRRISPLGKPVDYPRVEKWLPTRNELDAFEGRFRSRELDITYRFEVVDGALTASSLWSRQPMTFHPVVEGRFDSASSIMRTVVFQRDARGVVDGIVVHASRAKHLRFEKLP